MDSLQHGREEERRHRKKYHGLQMSKRKEKLPPTLCKENASF